MRKLGALIALAVVLGLVPASASHGPETFSAAGRVLLPTFGFPIVFGAHNACDPGSPIQGIGGYSVELPAWAPRHAFTLQGTPAQADVVWLTGPRGMTCTGLGYEVANSGMVPARANWAFIVLPQGRDSAITLTITSP